MLMVKSVCNSLVHQNTINAWASLEAVGLRCVLEIKHVFNCFSWMVMKNSLLNSLHDGTLYWIQVCSNKVERYVFITWHVTYNCCKLFSLVLCYVSDAYSLDDLEKGGGPRKWINLWDAEGSCLLHRYSPSWTSGSGVVLWKTRPNGEDVEKGWGVWKIWEKINWRSLRTFVTEGL